MSLVDNKTPPDQTDDGFTTKQSRQARKRKQKSRDGENQKRKRQQKRAKARKQKQIRQDSYGVPDEKAVETDLAGQVPVHEHLRVAFRHLSALYGVETPLEFSIFEEATREMDLTSFTPSDEQQVQELLDRILAVEQNRILLSGDDEDTKHVEVKDTLGLNNNSPDSSADLSMALSGTTDETISSGGASPVHLTPVSEIDPSGTNEDSTELKMDVLDAPTITTQPNATPTSATPPQQVGDAVHDDGNAVFVEDTSTAKDSSGRRKPKRKRRRKKKQGSEMSPPNVNGNAGNGTVDTPLRVDEMNVTVGGGRGLDLDESTGDDDLSPVMNGHSDVGAEYQVVEDIPMTPEEILQQEVDAFDCSDAQSLVLLRNWSSHLDGNYADKAFQQMYFDAKGVEKVVSSILRSPSQSICDREIVELFRVTLLGPRDYHEYLFAEAKRLALRLGKHTNIRGNVLDKIEQIISSQKIQPQSSAPEIEKEVFDMPSSNWSSNSNCPSFDMWQAVDSLADKLQKKYNLLRKDALETECMQPNKNPTFWISLTEVEELYKEGMSDVRNRELSAQNLLDGYKRERAAIEEAKRTKLQPLQQRLQNIRIDMARNLATKKKLEQDLAQVNMYLRDLETDQAECEQKIRLENDFANKDERLERNIQDHKFELAVLKSEGQCYGSLRSFALSIYKRMDAWSQQRISNEQDMRDGLAQEYLNQLRSFVEAYAKILNFYKNRVQFAHELAAKRTAEQKETLRLYGPLKARAYDEDILRNNREEQSDQKTADLVARNMYSYIDAGKKLVLESSFHLFIEDLRVRVGRTLDLTKYVDAPMQSERPMMLSGGIGKGRRETGSQTIREYAPRNPMPISSGSIGGHVRGSIPVMGRRAEYPNVSQPVPAVAVPRSQPQQVHATKAPLRRPVVFQQFGSFPVNVMGIPPTHMMAPLVNGNMSGVTVAAQVPRAPIGQMDIGDPGLQQRQARGHPLSRGRGGRTRFN